MDFNKMRDLNSKEKILKVKFKDGTETENLIYLNLQYYTLKRNKK